MTDVKDQGATACYILYWLQQFYQWHLCGYFVSDELEGCRSFWRHMSLSWQNAADDDLRWRPADSRRPGKAEPYRTVTSRPKWPSWSPPDAEPEASAAPVAPALCGHSVEPRTPNVQPHSEQTAAVEHRVAVVQATRNKRLDQRLGGVRWSDDLTIGRSCRNW